MLGKKYFSGEKKAYDGKKFIRKSKREEKEMNQFNLEKIMQIIKKGKK